jgi:hypothetical protein
MVGERIKTDYTSIGKSTAIFQRKRKGWAKRLMVFK